VLPTEGVDETLYELVLAPSLGSGVLELLLAKKLIMIEDLDSSNGGTLLHVAAALGNSDAVAFLLTKLSEEQLFKRNLKGHTAGNAAVCSTCDITRCTPDVGTQKPPTISQ
jgi:hypothetical protein